MLLIDLHKKMNIDTENKAFDYFVDNLKSTIKTYDYFVAWNKILSNIKDIEILLNILNSLIGKNNIEQELKSIIYKYPEVVPIIPILIACRDKTISIADIGVDHIYKFIRKDKFSDAEIHDIIVFTRECGFLQLLADKTIKSLVDYCMGVEVGLDSNARKNRSGTTMENLIENYIIHLCIRKDYRYLSQATATKIKKEFNIDVSTDKANRHFDFAICAKE